MIVSKIKESISNLEALSQDQEVLKNVELSAEVIISSLRAGNKVMICGNGGSAADAQHVAGEFLCRFYKDRQPLPAIALTTDTSSITAIANDYAYEEIFSRQVEALGKKGDVLLGISTSGTSKNVLRAFQKAHEVGVKTILLSGKSVKTIAEHADILINAPSVDTPRVQEMHLVMEHIICEIVEKAFCS
jgi:D-sedoheptulose 7-phosphate isomerase